MYFSEILIISINIALVSMSYLFVYPRFVGSDFNKLAINDLIVSSVSLLINGVRAIVKSGVQRIKQHLVLVVLV